MHKKTKEKTQLDEVLGVTILKYFTWINFLEKFTKNRKYFSRIVLFYKSIMFALLTGH